MKRSKKLKKPVCGHAPRTAHIRAITRELWLLYLYSGRARASFWYVVFTKKYPRRNVCDIYCTTYASRKRCEHVARSPWTRLSVSFAVVLCLLVVAQLAYPHDRALPLARLQGHGFVGFKTYGQIADKINDLDNKNITIQAGSATTVSSYNEMGIAVDAEATFSQLRGYTATERMVPFSILLAGNKTVAIDRHVDDAKLVEFIQKIETSSNKQPRDAEIKREGTRLVVMPAEDGYESSPQILKQQILQAKLQDGSIILSPRIVPPRISSQEAREKARLMQGRIDNPLAIKAAELTLTADSKVLAEWVDIIPRPEQGTIELSLNKARVENFLKPLQPSVEQAAKPEVVTLLNGLMAGSTQGTSGRSLSFGELVDEVAKTTNPGTSAVWAKVNSILPEQIYDRRYSRDSQGIQNLIDYWVQTHKGQHGVDFRTINGRIAASASPYKQFSAASSNRLFIAHLISGRLDAGSLRGGTATSAGPNVASCMDRMLRLSDGTCTTALGNIIGWGNSAVLLRSQGFTNTSLAPGGGSTSASDTSTWFVQLLNGGLTSEEQKNSLINMLSHQGVRTGISGHVYDTAVIYHPRGTYILSVLSDGGSFAAIAELTAQINKVLGE